MTAACRLATAPSSRWGKDGVPRSTWRDSRRRWEAKWGNSYQRRRTTKSKQTRPAKRNTCTVDLDIESSGVPHLQEARDPGGFTAVASDRLQEPAAGHHLPPDGVHTGPRQQLIEHRLHGQRAQASLRPESSIKQVRTLMSRRAATELTRRLGVSFTGGAVLFSTSETEVK